MVNYTVVASQVTNTRDWWSWHLIHLREEVCGLIELLSASSLSGPLHSNLTKLVARIAALTPAAAVMLSSAAIDVFLASVSANPGDSVVPADSAKDETDGLATDDLAAS